MMNEFHVVGFWDTVRLVNFIVLFIAFMVMLYKGIFRIVIEEGSFDWDRFMNLSWTLCSLYGIGEILYQNVGGGARVVVAFIVSALQLYVTIFQYHPKRNGTPRKLPSEVSDL